MKRFIKVILSLIILFATSGKAVALNAFEQNAQKQMNDYLRSHNYETRIMKDDNSINFMVGENIYWLTFKGDASGVLYTLHRRPIRLGEKNTSRTELNRLREKALNAAASMNAANDYKAYLKGNQVEFEFPVYATSPVEYQKVFNKVLSSLKRISMADFESEMKKATHTTDSIHRYWENYAPDKFVVRQPAYSNKPVIKPKGRVMASNPVVRSVDMGGRVLIPYGEIIYQDKMQFIQPRLTVMTDKPDTYRMSVKIINPDGKTMVSAKDDDMTLILPVEIGKKEKEIEFGTFGSTNNSTWKPGKYTLVFFSEGEEVARQTVNIL